MTIAALPLSPLRNIAKTFGLMLQRPPRTQLAALCYRDGENEPEVLLVTSRNAKRLIIPKGWPMEKYSARRTAEREAFEEAGIVGKAAQEPVGEFRSSKGMGNGFKIKTNIIVYSLKVDEQLADYPEIGQRETMWLPISDAAERCGETGLRGLLNSKSVKTLLMANK